MFPYFFPKRREDGEKPAFPLDEGSTSSHNGRVIMSDFRETEVGEGVQLCLAVEKEKSIRLQHTSGKNAFG
jgi:hypothetical protein